MSISLNDSHHLLQSTTAVMTFEVTTTTTNNSTKIANNPIPYETNRYLTKLLK